MLAAATKLTSSGRSDRLRTLYEPVVDRLLELQASTPAAHDACAEAVDRTLDHAVLRWETDYFRERFLVGHCHLAPEALTPLDEEFEALAAAVIRQPLVLLHRDFQSQNILLRDGRIGLVDFQGLRLGPLTYDIMSLICDPYVELNPDLQTDLLDRFCHGALYLDVVKGLQLTVKSLQAMAVAAGLQRIMQALGAYGYLGHVKGKTAFLAHIPRGLATLRRLLDDLVRLQSTAAPDQVPWLPAPVCAEAPKRRLRRLLDDLA